jgi:hypothetical protein
MMVEGRHLIHFAPRRGSGMRTSAGGSADEVTVTVLGESDSQRAEVPMRREDGAWRVVLSIPEPRSAGAD